MAKGNVARLRSAQKAPKRDLRAVAPIAPAQEPEIQSEAVLEHVELLYVALVGLHHLGKDFVLAADDIAPVLHLAGTVRTDMQTLDRQLTGEWAKRQGPRIVGRRGA